MPFRFLAARGSRGVAARPGILVRFGLLAALASERSLGLRQLCVATLGRTPLGPSGPQAMGGRPCL